MQVFITGATGYIGTAVAERLRAAGHELTGLARSEAAATRLTAAGIRPVRGDFSDPATVGSAAGAADGVISLATTYDPAIDGPAIDAILDALAGSNKPFVYTSGIWSHGDTGGAVVDETTPPKPAALVQWRQAVEDRVREGARRGIRSVVIRPAIVYGRGGGIPAGFVESARKGRAPRAMSAPAPTAGPSCTSTTWPSSTSSPWSVRRQARSCSASTDLRTLCARLPRRRAAGPARVDIPWPGRSSKPDRSSAPTPMPWCSTNRRPAGAPRRRWDGGRPGPMCSRTSSGDPMPLSFYTRYFFERLRWIP